MTVWGARVSAAAAGVALAAVTLLPMLAGHAAPAPSPSPSDAPTATAAHPDAAPVTPEGPPQTAAGAPTPTPASTSAPALVPALPTWMPESPVRDVFGKTVAPTVGAPSPAVYPPPVLPLTFDHARHLAREIGCERCHAAVRESTSAKDNLLPGETACRGCHEVDRSQPDKAVPAGEPAARCDACHPGFTGHPTTPGVPVVPARVLIPPPALKFNHRLHLARGMACPICHAGIETVALATSTELPKMALCLGCHDGRLVTNRCAACHITQPDGRLRTVFPSGVLAPSGSLRGTDAHTVAFRTDHRIAGRDEHACAVCHKPSECIECHGAGVIRPADFHPVDYATLHAIDAKRNVPNCSSCHRNQTFCLGCHQRLGVAPDPEGGLPGHQPNNPFGTGTAVKRFHPPGWARDDSGAPLTTPTPASHSFAAKRNLRACVSCHREESCLACHSADPTRSPGISPHRIGFASSAACHAMASRNARACLKCHAPGTAQLSCN